jgi:predicted enzyme related to lactoylglutathione lyase
VDRGGVASQLLDGSGPQWLPYVSVNDADRALALAKKRGGFVVLGPHDIDGIGRFGVVKDPTGAQLAVMKLAHRFSSIVTPVMVR